MNDRIAQIVFALLVLLVLLSPLPLGSNREWSWSLAVLAAAALGVLWLIVGLADPKAVNARLHPLIPLLFAVAVAWIVFQGLGAPPEAWHHPLWTMTGQVLREPVPGYVSLAPESGWIALMRLLGYALVFLLALQLGRRERWARTAFGWVTVGGLAYAAFGLAGYWGGYQPHWLFGDAVLAHDVRSTFVNRNHFATWQGLVLLCAIAWFYQGMARPEVKPYAVPKDREDRVEEFVLKAWKPMIAVLLMVAALILTHSRGGFVASLAGVVTLLWLLDRRLTGHGAGKRKVVSRVTAVTALAVAGIAFFLTSEILLDRINRTDITTEERVAVYANINRAIGDNPLLGFGYGTFADSFRLYDQNESGVHYDRAHNTWLENAFELGLPAALALYAALAGIALTCWKGMRRRHRDWVYPALGVAASVLVGVHALADFSLQIPAVAMLYAFIMGIACAQSVSSRLS